MLVRYFFYSHVFALIANNFVDSFRDELLHEHMLDPELVYYFHTSDRESVPKYEIVYLPLVSEALGGENGELNYEFLAFDEPINLKLRENKHMLPSHFKSYLKDGDLSSVLSHPLRNCHFLHKDELSVAAISTCDWKSVQGLIFMDNKTLEIHPLTDRLSSLLKGTEPLFEASEALVDDADYKVPHIIKRATIVSDILQNDIFPTYGNVLSENSYLNQVDSTLGDLEAASHRPVSSLTVELALFFDEAAYKIFAPHVNYDMNQLQDMLLAYLNGVQALYHHPSLGTTIELVLVRLDIMKTQPSSLPHYDGERSKLLKSFCSYQSEINSDDDSDPDHWDMALYVSGLDFFAYENGRKSGVTMGLATVGGVCLSKYDCIIAEFGTTNVFGKPYPSAGFTSVYILAHEIGHNLGMHHDGVGNSCPKEGYIMSPSRGTNGETQWSTCSSQVMSKLSWAKCLFDSSKSSKDLDHSRFLDSPGQVYTAKKQCEILLRDKDATVSPSQDLTTICYNLHCKTPHRSGYYFAGPALEGTQCGEKKYCYGGSCINRLPPAPEKVVVGGWSPWKEGDCSSGCIEKSRGFQMKRRYCNNPTPVNTDEGCEGSSVEFGICMDSKICKRKRLSVTDYASDKCREFSRVLQELDKAGTGLQAPHEEARVWMGCAIFCKRADSKAFYTPRLELNDLGVSPYFPDGTWCHRAGNLNYYCLHHHCLPENFQFTKKTSVLHQIGEDIPFSQNANPSGIIPPEVKSYFSLNSDGRPMKTELKFHEAHHPKEEDWETDDFIEIPGLKERFGLRAHEDGDGLFA